MQNVRIQGFIDKNIETDHTVNIWMKAKHE